MDNGLDQIYDRIRDKICQNPLEQAYVRAEFNNISLNEWVTKNSDIYSIYSWKAILKDNNSDYFIENSFSSNELDIAFILNSKISMSGIRQIMANKINEGIDRIVEFRKEKIAHE